MTAYKEIEKCRVSGSKNLVSVLNLGHQVLTGVFPKSASEKITSGPLELVWCPDGGLLQLRHSYDPDEMYGLNYGYRSGLNQSMVNHLTEKVKYLERLAGLKLIRARAERIRQRRRRVGKVRMIENVEELRLEFEVGGFIVSSLSLFVVAIAADGDRADSRE